MHEPPPKPLSDARPHPRRGLAIVAALVLVSGATAAGMVAAVGRGHATRVPAPKAAAGRASVRFGGQVRSFPTRDFMVAGRPDTRRLAAIVRHLVPMTRSVTDGPAHITYGYDRGRAVRRLAALGQAGGLVDVPQLPVAVTIDARPVRQALRNDCEATALQILLSTVGERVDQRTLQSQLPRSGGADPVGDGPGMVWGDPELGFVGRPEGGGRAGGFGVYQRPILAVARRHGVHLADLSGASPGRLFDRLLSGHAVMVWVGLSDGPYKTWRSPADRSVTVNFGEHSLVLTGLSKGSLTVANPLTGGLERWSFGDFLVKWGRLGRRAVSA